MKGALAEALGRHERLAIAVSGGVDSLTLAHAAHRLAKGLAVEVLHAVSPAVDPVATQRVQAHAARHAWALRLIEAGEFSDPAYLRNPVNRCFFCKSNLYGRISAETDAVIASGTNTDDLGDFRPGLQAAKDRAVVHPFVEAGMAKQDVRALARGFGLEEIAEMPAQPCLASRVETGIAINAEDLAFVAGTEHALAALAPKADIRCRIVHGGVRIELGDEMLRDPRARQIAQAACDAAGRKLLSVAPYRRGSAFLHDR